ncbi:Aste57867_21650 [Aphanomyces stellatus]|uniref:Aste57867_21650 protein n=1 Tax=Aphanomyces stellatus TaxID=120398 RepID=A0A485LJB4_9STRA|nr:hypothetical protein As57867_021581 [Aphanomyces stellatus]VFT98319.1 Aste57867_21650 [Aphanomyces stellatus]
MPPLRKMGTVVTDRIAWYLVCIKKSFAPSSRRIKPCHVESPDATAHATFPIHNETTGVVPEVNVPHLPPGWKTCMSRTRGELYYTHSKSNTKQWHHPLPPVVLPPGWTAYWSHDSDGAWYFCNKDLRLKQWVPPTPNDVLPPLPLPLGWKGYKSRRSGLWYFKNKALRLRQREYPSQESDASPLPDAWKSYVGRNGDVYYKNKAARVMQWERPTAETRVPTMDLPDGWFFMKGRRGKWFFENSAQGLKQWDYPVDEGSLPPGWRARLSAKKCQLYYEHKDLKITQWSPPVL